MRYQANCAVVSAFDRSALMNSLQTQLARLSFLTEGTELVLYSQILMQFGYLTSYASAAHTDV